MFNFTTQTIFNDLTGRCAQVNIDGSDSSKYDLRVDNIIFKQGTVESVEKKLPSNEVLSSVMFDFTELHNIFVEGGPTKASARIALYLGLTQSSVDSFYANDFVYKGKPVYVEFPVVKGVDSTATAQAAALAFQKVAKVIFKSDADFLTVTLGNKVVTVDSNDTTLTGVTVTISAVSGYQIIRSAEVQVYDDSIFAIDCCSAEGGFKVFKEATPFTGAILVGNGSSTRGMTNATALVAKSLTKNADTIYPGAEAFGDYNWIMHNLRIPTDAATSYWSPLKKAGDLPVPGGKYVQYTIKVCADRENIAGNVVGEKTKSVTTHVLYVLNSLDVSDLETWLGAMIANSGTIKTNADTAITSIGA